MAAADAVAQQLGRVHRPGAQKDVVGVELVGAGAHEVIAEVDAVAGGAWRRRGGQGLDTRDLTQRAYGETGPLGQCQIRAIQCVLAAVTAARDTLTAPGARRGVLGLTLRR